MPQPNVLLIVFDTARADAFELNSGQYKSTPSFAQLAGRGFAHRLAYAPSSWTVPSHAALFAGQLPRTTGIHLGGQDRNSFKSVLQALEPRLLPSVLSTAGYRTVGVSANGWVNESSGFDSGFDDYRYLASPRYTRLGSFDLKSRARWALDGLQTRLDDGAEQIRQLLAETIRGTTPFFCFVNLVECHSPYLPPRPYNPLGWRERLRAVDDANRYYTFEALCRTCLGALEVPDDSLDRMRRLYDASIAQLDSWLGQVLEDLEGAGLLADTQVIVTSDHGENFGEGGLTGHQFSLDERLLRIPFASAGPLDLQPPPTLSLIDVPGLLGDALDLVDHPWSEDGGDSNVAVAQFEAPAPRGNEIAERLVRDWNLDERGQRRLFRSFTCATDGRWKLLRDAAGEEVIDLHADPLEERPRGGETTASDGPPAATLARLRRAIDRADTLARTELPGDSTIGHADEQVDLEAQMRLLGYL